MTVDEMKDHARNMRRIAEKCRTQASQDRETASKLLDFAHRNEEIAREAEEAVTFWAAIIAEQEKAHEC